MQISALHNMDNTYLLLLSIVAHSLTLLGPDLTTTLAWAILVWMRHSLSLPSRAVKHFL